MLTQFINITAYTFCINDQSDQSAAGADARSTQPYAVGDITIRQNLGILNMSGIQSNHPQALRSSLPGVSSTPHSPEPLSTSVEYSSTDTALSDRIVPSVLVVPEHESIISTLGHEQFTELLPTLHIYMNPLRPNVAVIPADLVSYNGLIQALRWREADDSQSMQGSLAECIEIYQALSFFGNKTDSQSLRLLEELIQAEIEGGLSLADVQNIWSLRRYPCTDRFVNSMLKQLVADREMTEDNDTIFFGRTSADAELDELLAETAAIFQWIEEDQELGKRFKCMQARTEGNKAQMKRDRRMAIVLGRSSPPSNMPIIITQARQARRARPHLINLSN